MFRSFSNTWSIVKTSWHVLQKDRELILFPIMSGIGVLIVVGVAVGAFAGMGTFDRLDSTEEAQANAGDIIIAVAALLAGFFVIHYFNAALIGAARHRLKGGDPSLGTGFAAVNKHIVAVMGWTVISVVVFLILQLLRSRHQGFIYNIIIGLVGAAWAYMTFFVIPVLIVEGVGPIEAIKRSAGYFKRTWGEQLVSNFGFGLLMGGVVLIAALPMAAVYAVSPVAAIIVGVPLIGIGISIVQTLEGIFKAALYEYAAEGVMPKFFEPEVLSGAYARGTQAYR